MALGWVWRGQRDRIGEGRNLTTRETPGETGKTIRRIGKDEAGSLDEKVAGSASAAAHLAGGGTAELPEAAAHRLLKSMLAEGFQSGPPVELFEFLQALSGCNTATLQQLLTDLRKATKESGKSGRGRDPLAMMILARLASIDPEGAMDGFIDMKKDGGRVDREMMFFMLSAAAKADPARAQAMIDRMPDEESKNSARAAFLMVRARQDPDGALNNLAAAPPSDDAGFSQAREIIKTAAAKSPEKALETVQKFGTPEQQSQLVSEVMQNWLERDPKSAAQWASATMDVAALNACLRVDASLLDTDKLRQDFNSFNSGSPEVRTQLAGSLAANLAQKDVNSALTWAAGLTGADQTAANAGIGRSWIDKDVVGASEWLATWPNSPAKDGVAGYLVNKISAEDPESALAWACTIRGDQRNNSIGKALSAMKSKDPAAAEQALNGLPEYERASVKSAMEQRKGR
ncbi:MAG: hypothetical protein ACR2OZ_19865 [Verrucomicrobiales bacterium]